MPVIPYALVPGERNRKLVTVDASFEPRHAVFEVLGCSFRDSTPLLSLISSETPATTPPSFIATTYWRDLYSPVYSFNMGEIKEIHTPPADGDFSRGPTILAIAVISMAIAFVSVCIRLFIRIRMTKNLWWDDALIVGGLVRWDLLEDPLPASIC